MWQLPGKNLSSLWTINRCTKVETFSQHSDFTLQLSKAMCWRKTLNFQLLYACLAFVSDFRLFGWVLHPPFPIHIFFWYFNNYYFLMILFTLFQFISSTHFIQNAQVGQIQHDRCKFIIIVTIEIFNSLTISVLIHLLQFYHTV